MLRYGELPEEGAGAAAASGSINSNMQNQSVQQVVMGRLVQGPTGQVQRALAWTLTALFLLVSVIVILVVCGTSTAWLKWQSQIRAEFTAGPNQALTQITIDSRVDFGLNEVCAKISVPFCIPGVFCVSDWEINFQTCSSYGDAIRYGLVPVPPGTDGRRPTPPPLPPPAPPAAGEPGLSLSLYFDATCSGASVPAATIDAGCTTLEISSNLILGVRVRGCASEDVHLAVYGPDENPAQCLFPLYQQPLPIGQCVEVVRLYFLQIGGLMYAQLPGAGGAAVRLEGSCSGEPIEPNEQALTGTMPWWNATSLGLRGRDDENDDSDEDDFDPEAELPDNLMEEDLRAAGRAMMGCGAAALCLLTISGVLATISVPVGCCSQRRKLVLRVATLMSACGFVLLLAGVSAWGGWSSRHVGCSLSNPPEEYDEPNVCAAFGTDHGEVPLIPLSECEVLYLCINVGQFSANLPGFEVEVESGPVYASVAVVLSLLMTVSLEIATRKSSGLNAGPSL